MKILTNSAFNRWSLVLAVVVAVVALAFMDKLTEQTIGVLLGMVLTGVLTRSGVAVGTKGQAKPDDT